MYPGRTDPDFGVFVAQLVGALERRGHEVERAVVDHRGGSKAKQLTLTAAAFRGARAHPAPDVIYAHFLAPAGVVAAAASVAGGGTPLVLTAHGRDVRNLAEMAAVRMATGSPRAAAQRWFAVSGWLRDRLVAALPELAGRDRGHRLRRRPRPLHGRRPRPRSRPARPSRDRARTCSTSAPSTSARTLSAWLRRSRAWAGGR
jgi:hypothetical protein